MVKGIAGHRIYAVGIVEEMGNAGGGKVTCAEGVAIALGKVTFDDKRASGGAHVTCFGHPCRATGSLHMAEICCHLYPSLGPRL